MDKARLDGRLRPIQPVYWLAVFLVLLLAACAVGYPYGPYSSTGSTHERFLDAWSSQLEQYRADFIARDVKVREQAKKAFDPDTLRTAADPWQSMVTRVFELTVMIREEFTIAGRGETIKAFIVHMQSHPSAGLTEMWFQRQVEDAQREARDIDAKTNAFLRAFGQKVLPTQDWVGEVEELAREQGKVTGKIEELQSLYRQAQSYYAEIAQAQAMDQYQAQQQAQAAQALLATGMYLNQLNYQQRQLDYQQQFLNTLNRPRTCTFFGNRMTCM